MAPSGRGEQRWKREERGVAEASTGSRRRTPKLLVCRLESTIYVKESPRLRRSSKSGVMHPLPPETLETGRLCRWTVTVVHTSCWDTL